MSLSSTRLGSLSSKEETPTRRDEKPPDPFDSPADNVVQRCVIIQKDERGYGLTVSGNQPVYVQSVKDNGAAARAGVKEGDKIVKVNGTLVVNFDHVEVVKLIKSGSYVALTLLGKPEQQNKNSSFSSPPVKVISQSVSRTPSVNTPERTSITGPQPVDAHQQERVARLKLETLRAMQHQALTEYENIRKENNGKNPEKLKGLLEEKKKTLNSVEKKIKTISPSDPYVNSANLSQDSGTTDSLETIPEPGVYDQPTYRNPTWSKSLPSTVLDGTGICYPSQLTPSTSPTLIHQHNRHDSDSLDTVETRDSRRDSGVGTMSEEASSSISYRKVNPQQVDVISMEDDEFSEEEGDSEDHGPFMALSLLEKKQAHMAVFLHYLISNSDPSPLFFCIVADLYANSQAGYKDLRKWAYEIMATFLAVNAPLRVEVDDAILGVIEEIIQNKSDKEDPLRGIFQQASVIARNITEEYLADFRRQKSLGLGNIYGVHRLQDDSNKQKELKIIHEYLLPHLDRLMNDEGSTDRNEAMAAALVTFCKQVGGIKSTEGGIQIAGMPSFVAKDKRSIKFPGMSNKKNSLVIRGHQLTAQHYSQMTKCAHCQHLIGGLGYPGYICSSCEMHYHKYCVDKMEDCIGKKKKRMSVLSDIMRKQSNVSNPTAKDNIKLNDEKSEVSPNSGAPLFEIKTLSDEKDPDWNRLKEQGHSVGNLVKIYEDTSGQGPEAEQTPATKKKGSEIGRSESMKGRGDQRHEKSSGTRRTKRPHELSYTDIRDVDVDETLKSLNHSGSSSTSSLSTSNSSEAVNDLKQLIEDDSDFDVETELPPLKQLLPDDTVKKLKPKEKKRQEVINELFYTERSHLRNMKVLDRVFYRPMSSEPNVIHKSLVNQLFPNLEQLINLHSALNNAMKARRKETPVVNEVGDILLQRFDGEAGSEFREGCAIFCRGQSYALEQLRIKQRRDEKFSRLLSEAESNPLCRRLQLKDLIPTAFQRLTKYPLLIENLMKYTQTNSEDYSRLERALKRSKSILDYVNQAVRECENHQRLVEINKRLDRKPFENSNNPNVAEFKNLDLTKRKLVHDGTLTWRLSRNKQIELQVVLLEDILVLLQKQDDKLVLKCQSTTVVAGKDDTKYTHSPVVRLTNLLTRNVATDKKAFFLVSNPNLKPQIYELVSASSEDRKKWFKHITEAADSYKLKEKELLAQNGKPGNSQASQQESEQITHIRPQITSRERHREGSGETSEGASSSPTPYSSSDVVESDDSGVERAGVSDIPEVDTSQLIQPEDVTVTDPLIVLAEPVLTPQAAASPATEDEPQTPTPDMSAAPPSLTSPNAPIPMDKLRMMAGRMNSILSNLLTVVGNKEEEQDRLRQELKSAQQQLALVKELQKDSFNQSDRPSSMISIASSTSDPADDTQAQLEESQASVDALHRMLMGGGGGNIRAEDILMADSTFTQSTDLDSSDWADLSEDVTDSTVQPQVTDVDEETFYEDKGGSSGEEGKFFPAEESLEITEESPDEESSDQDSSSTTPVQDVDSSGTISSSTSTEQSENKGPSEEQIKNEGSSVDQELIAEDPSV